MSNPLQTDRNLRSAMQVDAKKLVERFLESYQNKSGEEVDDQENASAVNHLLEILEYLVAEN